MNKLKTYLFALLALVIALPALAQMPQVPQLPIDPAVRYGKLPNGLTYYIRHNNLPEGRANFYIAQKVGSVQEEENQRGLAHFLEHMCFNGTTHFPDNTLTQYCERIGVKFGQNLNAYTSTDETVYNIDDVPVTEANVDSCLLILHDWSDDLTLDPKEIDKERGVIHEEWRMRSSASGRIFERNLPTLYPGSRYGHRYPIGLMSVVDNFKPEELRAYYEKWYRPDLQGIIIVGDIDVDKVEAKVKALFSPIKMPANAAKYEHYPVPDNDQPIYVVDKDKEQTRGVMQVMFKTDPLPEEYRGTAVFLQMNLVNTLACDVINARLNELSQKADCPFIAASADYDTYIFSKTKDALTVGIMPKPGQDAKALQAVIEEIERVDRYGFTPTEVSRASEEFMSSLEKIYNNRDKQENSFYVPQYVRHFLEGDAIPNIETEYTTYKQLVQMLNAQQMMTPMVSEVFKQYTAHTDTNFVCLGMYPDAPGVTVPTVDQLKAAVAAAKTAKLEAYVDNVKSEPLVAKLPKAGKIVKEAPAQFGYTCWTLSNGARVFFKKTDFNDAEVRFNATSLGGRSKVADKDLANLGLFETVISNTGLGDFTGPQLTKKLAGKQASCNVHLGQLTEGLNGTATPKDLRTLFELIYLRFQQPANDVEGYNNAIAYVKTSLENAEKNPMKAFSDSISATLYGHNKRTASLKLADLKQADYNVIRRLYSERFGAAGDFDFFFTGAINTDSLRLFAEQYIAPLGTNVKKREQFTDLKIDPVTGKHDNNFLRKMETPQAMIVQIWNGTVPYSLKENAIIGTLASILTQRYLKSIREDAGIAYSVFAQGEANYGTRDDYSIIVQCPVKPAKLDSALLLIRQGIEEIGKKGVTADELDKVLKFELKDYADNQKKNEYWQNLIEQQAVWGKDRYTGYEAAYKSVTSKDVQDFVNNVLLKQGNCVTVSMRPTDLTEKENAK